MKRILYIALILLLVCGACQKEHPAQNDVSVDIHFPYSSYIFFNASQATKGELINDNLIGKTFAVTAYRYDGEWGIVSKGQCLPNLFWNFPVTYENGAHVYDATTNDLNIYTDSDGNKLELMPWEDGMRYTFYAHYPYNNSYIQVSSVDGWHGEPYIDFTLPEDPDDMFDLMTAGIQDEDNSLDNYVTLRMYHRLASFDVFVSNNIQSIEVDGEEKNVSVKISNLSVTFNNLMYSKASFWMNRLYQPDPDNYRPGFRSLTPYGTAGAEKSFGIIDDGSSVVVANESRDNISGANGRSLLIIPQRLDGAGNYLNGTVNFDCEFVDENGTSVVVPLLQPDNTTVQVSSLTGQSMSFNVNKNVDHGYTYYLELAFINGVITLRVQSTPTWDENVNSNIEFN